MDIKKDCKKHINKSNFPDHVIEALTRCWLPDIIECFESEEGQKAFAEWKAQNRVQDKSESSS